MTTEEDEMSAQSRSLVKEVDDICDRIERRQQERRWSVYASNTMFTLYGILISIVYLGFNWYAFKLASVNFWAKLIRWAT